METKTQEPPLRFHKAPTLLGFMETGVTGSLERSFWSSLHTPLVLSFLHTCPQANQGSPCPKGPPLSHRDSREGPCTQQSAVAHPLVAPEPGPDEGRGHVWTHVPSPSLCLHRPGHRQQT